VYDKPRKPNTKAIKSAGDDIKLKKEDVELIMDEFDIPKAQAEKALRENGGDLERTIWKLVEPVKPQEPRNY